MESKVLEKMVFIDDEQNVCFCDKQFSKTCAVRIANSLSCREAIVRITFLDGEESMDAGVFLGGVVDKELVNIKNSLSKTLHHLDRFRR